MTLESEFGTFRHLDTVLFQTQVLPNHAISSSEDNRYSICLESGVYVLHLCGMMDSVVPIMSFKKQFINIPEYAVSDNLGIDINSFVKDLSRLDLYETVLRLELSEKLDPSSPIKQNPTLTGWSPLGLAENNHCALATLTNTGSLDVFVRWIDESGYEEFIPLTNISKHCINYFKSTWQDVANKPKDLLEELKRRVTNVMPCAFAWSNLFELENIKYCLLIVGHLGGKVSIWKIKFIKSVKDYQPIYLACFDTQLSKITALHWQTAGNAGLIIAGDLKGRVKAIAVKNVTDSSLTVGAEMILWEENDKIAVDLIKVQIFEGKTYIFIVKSTFLLTFMVSDSGKLLDMHNFHVGNFFITGFQHYHENTFLVITANGVLKEFKVACRDEKIQVDYRELYIDYKWSTCSVQGIIVSPNRIFIGMLANVYHESQKTSKYPGNFLVFTNTTKRPLTILMGNSTRSLGQYWDCLEVLRVTSLKDKKAPSSDLPDNLDFDKMSLLQLKTFLWLIKASEAMSSRMYVKFNEKMVRYENLRHMVKIKVAIEHAQHLLDLIGEEIQLDDFHMQSLDIVTTYLKEAVMQNVISTLQMERNTIDELFEVLVAAQQLQYPAPPQCIWCGENIIGLSCIPAHIDSRCCISFMPVMEFPYYKCNFCQCVLHYKLNEVYPIVLCPYCDITMDIVSFIDSRKEENKIRTCFLDCLQETIDFEDVEEHAFVEDEKKGDFVDLLRISGSTPDGDKVSNIEL